MILVSVGASDWPFDRLLEPFDALDLDEDVVAQCGVSSIRPRGATCSDFMPFETLSDHIRHARVVVTHGGMGSVLTALAHGKRPVVLPRLRRFGEAIDDHQVDSARHLADAGLVTVVEDPAKLVSVVLESPPPTLDHFDAADDGRQRLVDELRAHVLDALARRHGSTARHPSPIALEGDVPGGER
jgi:UDP-N-acetylglucosamine transferase subunit ALG13